MKPTLNMILVSLALMVLFHACGPAPSDKIEAKASGYHEQYRPQFHFSPDSMWMNDPNGMVYYEGEYHLFYQHNPYSNVWGPMHWGHAVSTDLVHWEHLPIALFPDSLGAIFSGSAVIDWENSSGLGTVHQPPMVAIFTHHNHNLEEIGSEQFEVQSIAFSLDNGRSWTKYHGNPVLGNPGIRDFRDPKVVWYEEGELWIMVLAAHDRILFYTSPDLINWNRESEFLSERPPGEGVWECPDLFPLSAERREKWVLIVSVNSGGPQGGSGTKYFVGNFDGHQFRCQNQGEESLWLDHGKDNYAGVTWSDIPERNGRRVFLGWMSNWQYANQVPTDRWRSASTLPRELKLIRRDGRYLLCSRPVSELKILRQVHVEFGELKVTDTMALEGLYELTHSQYELDLVFHRPEESSEDVPTRFGFVLGNDLGQQLPVGIDLIHNEVYVERTFAGESGFSKHYPGIHTAPYQPGQDQIRIKAFIDHSSIELFVDDGRVVMTEILFPDDEFNNIALFSKNGKVILKKGTIYSLKSSW